MNRTNRQTGAISPKLTLALLGIMFLVPLTVAWLMYSGVIDYRPGTSVNRGILVDPPVRAEVPESFAESGLAEHWVLTYIIPPDCNDACREQLHGLGQIHRALGRDAVRVRIMLVDNGSPEGEFRERIEAPGQGFHVISENSGALIRQLDSLGDRNGTFIIDPLGNIMMRYAGETDPNDILFDMERLLQYQKTDPQ